MPTQPHYKRVLLKLSGEALMGRRDYGLDNDTVRAIATDIGDVVAMGVQVCVVIGGGNIFRGVSGAASGMERAQADYHRHARHRDERSGHAVRPGAARHCRPACSPPSRCRRSASPTFAAAPSATWRRAEWSSSPPAPAIRSSPPTPPPRCAPPRWAATPCSRAPRWTASIPPIRARCRTPKRYEQLTYLDVLANDLEVMDAAAISLARENNLPILVFNIHAPGAFAAVMRGEGRFTRIIEQS